MGLGLLMRRMALDWTLSCSCCAAGIYHVVAVTHAKECSNLVGCDGA